MAKIYKFEDKNGKKPHHRPQDEAKLKHSEPSTFGEIYHDVVSAWIHHTSHDNINEYFHLKIPDECKLDKSANYCQDLNIISGIEKKLGMSVVSYYPKTTPENSHGWMAAFKHKRWVFSTPPDMTSEESARAINILLFIVFKGAIGDQ
jgi:hypothetical protein